MSIDEMINAIAYWDDFEKAIECISENLISLFSENTENDASKIKLHHEMLKRTESKLIKTIIVKFKYNQTKTAAFLGLSRTTLRKKLSEFGIM